MANEIVTEVEKKNRHYFTQFDSISFFPIFAVKYEA